MAGGRTKRETKPGTVSSAASAPGLSREDALQSLQQAFETLKALPQGKGDLDSARALCQPSVMRHASPEVRLWAAKCLAEVLRIFVPSPPFETERFRPILELFLEQLASLNPSAQTYAYAFGLLERLEEIRGFMLVFDCATSDVESLIVSLAKTCIGAAKAARQSGRIGATEDAQRRLEVLLARLLSDVLLEADEVPEAVLEQLLEEIVERKSPGGAMVRQVLTNFTNFKNQRVALPLNDLLNKSLFLSQDDKAELSQDRLEGLLNATYELYCIHPSLVVRVLPNIHADLQCAKPDRRRAITAFIAQLLAHHQVDSDGGSSCGMALASSSGLAGLVERFQDRLADADDGVRMTALEGASAVLQSVVATGCQEDDPAGSASMAAAESIRTKVAHRCLDPNDAVRLRAVEICTHIALASDDGLAFMLPNLSEICKRILDKKPRIREACAQAAAQLYAQHALPHWLKGEGQKAHKLCWIPQLLCEAYSVFCGARLGYVAQIEELIEQHILGCGAGLPQDQRALALVGLCSSALCGAEAAKHGLGMLLSKKRDAHKALRRFVRARLGNAAPLGEVRSTSLLPSESKEGETPAVPFADLFENLAKWSPTLDDKYARPEALGLHLRSLDAVRDKTLWAHLDHLLDPDLQDSTCKMSEQVCELDRLLRVHRLGEIAPLIRRALMSTWLLPDQVAALLDLWTSEEATAPDPDMVSAARRTVGYLPKYFLGAFLPFVGEMVKLLPECSQEDAQTILQALSRLQKQVCVEGVSSQLDETGLPELLLQALHVMVPPFQNSARKFLRILLLLSDDCRASVVQQLLSWADGCLRGGGEDCEGGEGEGEVGSTKIVALHLAAAILENSSDCGEACRDYNWKPLLEVAQNILLHPSAAGAEPESSLLQLQCAAAEVVAAGSGASLLATVMQGFRSSAQGSQAIVPLSETNGQVSSDGLLLHLACASLRSLRFGCVELSTALLAQLSETCGHLVADGRPAGDGDKLLHALQKFQKHAKLKIADRLRLCTTLPSIFCFGQKKHRDAGQKMLQGWLRTARQGSQPGLLDFSVACFVHFLSRLQIFEGEESAAVSAFPESSKVSSFFCEALLHCDSQGAELLGTALRVCDRTRYFVDREDCTSSMRTAASVLRYVAERRCPELGLQAAALLQGAARGSMPAQLFAVDPVVERRLNAAVLKDRLSEQEHQLPETPALQDVGQASDSSPLKTQVLGVSQASMLEDASVLTTPQRRPSLLKRGSGSSPQTPSPGSNKRSLTGGAVSAALAAQSSKKAKKQRGAC